MPLKLTPGLTYGDKFCIVPFPLRQQLAASKRQDKSREEKGRKGESWLARKMYARKGDRQTDRQTSCRIPYPTLLLFFSNKAKPNGKSRSDSGNITITGIVETNCLRSNSHTWRQHLT